MGCPNKNTKEWQLLVQQVGEKNAYTIFIALEEKLPNSEQGINEVIKQFLDYKKELLNPEEDDYYYEEDDYNPEDDIDIDAQELFDYIEDDSYSFEDFAYDEYTVEDNEDFPSFSPSEIKLKFQYKKFLQERINILINHKKQLDKNNKIIESDKIKDELKVLIEKSNKLKQGLSVSGLMLASSEDFDILKTILSQKEIKESDIKNALEITKFWINIFPNNVENFFKLPVSIINEYREIITKFELVQKEIYKHQNTVLETFVNKETNNKVGNLKEYLANIKDIGAFKASALFIGRNHNLILQSIGKVWNKIQAKINEKVQEDFEDIDELSERVSNELKKLGYKDFSIFQQKFKTGERTLELVNQYSAEYNKEYYENFKNIKNFKSFLNYVSWSKKNQFVLDVRKLFPDTSFHKEVYTEEDVEKYKQEILTHISEDEFLNILDEQKKLLDTYKEQRDSYIELINNSDELSVEQKSEKIINWQKFHSPYYYNHIYENAKKEVSDGYKSLINIPYKYKIEDGKKIDTEYYDKNFLNIKNNEILFEYWTYMVDLMEKLNGFLPSEKTHFLSPTSLPKIKKVLFENMADNIWATPTKLFEKFKEDISLDKSIDNEYQKLDITGKVKNKQILKYLPNSNTEIGAVLKRLYLQHLSENDTISKEQKLELHKKASEIVSEKYSFNLPKILKYYSLMAHTYDTKNKVEPLIQITKRVLDDSKESLFDKNGNVINKNAINSADSFINTKNALNYFIQSFYGKTQIDQYSTKIAVKTEEEKLYEIELLKEKEKLETELENIKDKNINDLKPLERVTSNFNPKRIKEIDRILEVLGGEVVGSKIGNKFLGYTQILQIGWNLISAINNVTIGVFGNIIEAHGEQFFSTKSYNKALTYSLSSIARNWSFNNTGIKNINKTGEKIRNIMDKFDILSEINQLEESGGYNNIVENKVLNKLKFLSPFNLNQRTEYLNQSTILTAMLFENKLNIDGEEVDIFEVLNDTGEIKDEYKNIYSKKDLDNLILQVKGVIDRTHGDYRNLKALKNTLLGRSLTTFRTWMFEGIATKIEAEQYDAILETNVKGRYRSYKNAYFYNEGENQFEIMQGSLKLITDSLLNIIGKTIGVNKIRTLMGLEKINYSKFQNDISEIDVINMQKNMQEIYFWTFTLIGGMIAALGAGDDDDDKKKGLRQVFLINMFMRLHTDLEFYINPKSTLSILREPLPAVKVFLDWGYLIDAIGDTMKGKGVYTKGIYKDQNKITVRASKVIPGANSVTKTYQFTKEVLKKK